MYNGMAESTSLLYRSSIEANKKTPTNPPIGNTQDDDPPPLATADDVGQHRVNAKPDDFVVIGLFRAGALHLPGLMLCAGILIRHRLVY